MQGFLPRKGGGRAEALELLRRLPATIVLYEAGNRTGETLRELASVLGDRPAAVARELTKLHEEIARGTLSALAERFAAGARGEVTLVVAGASGEEARPDLPQEPLEEELRRRMAAGETPSGIAREVARARGLRRAEVYDALERLKHDE